MEGVLAAVYDHVHAGILYGGHIDAGQIVHKHAFALAAREAAGVIGAAAAFRGFSTVADAGYERAVRGVVRIIVHIAVAPRVQVGQADRIAVGLHRLHAAEGVIIAGRISSVKDIFTKKQELMSFVELEDVSGTVEVIVFPKSRQKYANLLADDAKIIVEGRVSVEEGKPPKVILLSARPLENTPVSDNGYRTDSYSAEPSVSVYEDGNRPQEQECPPAAESRVVFSLNEEPRRKPGKIWVLFNTCASLMEDKPFIDDLCARYPGEDLIIFYIKDGGRKFGRKAGICRNMAQELINRYTYRNVKLPASGK